VGFVEKDDPIQAFLAQADGGSPRD